MRRLIGALAGMIMVFGGLVATAAPAQADTCIPYVTCGGFNITRSSATCITAFDKDIDGRPSGVHYVVCTGSSQRRVNGHYYNINCALAPYGWVIHWRTATGGTTHHKRANGYCVHISAKAWQLMWTTRN